MAAVEETEVVRAERPGRETEKGLQEVNRESMEQSVQHEMFWLFHS